jgi:hypothetical protein
MKQSLLFLRGILLTAAVLSLSALYRVMQVLQTLDISISQKKWLFLIGLFIVITMAELFLFGLTWSKKAQQWIEAYSEYELDQPFLKAGALVLFVLLLGFYSWLIMASPMRGFLMGGSGGNIIVLGPQNGTLKIIDVINGVVDSILPTTGRLINSGLQWWLFLICSIVLSVLLKISRGGLSITKAFLTAILGQAVIFRILAYLPSISSYPFSTVWSEGSRWYYASLLFSNKLYGYALFPSFIDFPLDILDSAPFILGKPSIFVFRSWSVLLNLGLAIAAILLLVRRLKITDHWMRWMLTAWCFLFLFQEGSIYPHLLLSVIFVLAGFSTRKPWRSLVVIALASFWVGMDRINWYPVPGLLAVALYLLEEPVHGYGNLIQYLKKPFIWIVVGLSAAILGWVTVTLVTGSGLKESGSAISSLLLWYRLLPNPTYRFGILPAILFVSIPILLVIGWGMRKSNLHILRLLGLGGIILVLFIGGLISSIKVGGGSDLHNMDAYTVFVLIIGVYFYLQRIAGDSAAPPSNIPAIIVILTLIINTIVVIQGVQLRIPYDQKLANNVIANLNNAASRAAEEGEVLFINQRQLITFGDIKSVPLTPDYELVTLMEMVMSNNQPYLDRFHNDLRNHRFSLIVVEAITDQLKGPKYAFGEENDLWDLQVARPLLCSYESYTTLAMAGVQLFVPRPNHTSCP